MKVSRSLDRVEARLGLLETSLHSCGMVLEGRWSRLEQIVDTLWSQYRLLQLYQQHKDTVERHTLMDFAQAVSPLYCTTLLYSTAQVSSHGPGTVRSLLLELHRLVVAGGPLSQHRGRAGVLAALLARGVKVGTDWIWVRYGNSDHTCTSELEIHCRHRLQPECCKVKQTVNCNQEDNSLFACLWVALNLTL